MSTVAFDQIVRAEGVNLWLGTMLIANRGGS